MKTDLDYYLPVRTTLGIQGRLRIAIPAWGTLRSRAASEQAEPKTLSREEVARLFHGDLNPSRPRKLTETETRERDLQDSIRRALYPAGEKSA